MTDGKCNWPRGRVLGGSSTINGMVYIRGNKKDYDEWEQLGNPGWNFRDVLEYFKKSEDMTIQEHLGDTFHGTGGPLTIEHYRYHTPLASSFLDAVQELG